MDINRSLEKLHYCQKNSMNNQALIYQDFKKLIAETKKNNPTKEEIIFIAKNISVISMDIEIIKDRIQNIMDDIYDLQTEMQNSKIRINNTNINISISDKFLITIFIISYLTFIFLIMRE